ncbi:MAG: class I adenylate-forming enzyme family protein [Lachnospiraceae bacterium]|nr:class I adenylate-forming enzyme family protein [Lachnospiraceae bacterium]
MTGKHTGYPSIDKPWMKYYENDNDSTSYIQKTIYRNIYDNSKGRLDSYALQYFNIKISYREMFEKVDMCVEALSQESIKAGDCVNLCVSNIPEVAYVVLACSKIGAIANFINPLFTTEQKIERMRETESKILIVLDAMFEYVDECIEQINISKVIIIPATNSLPWIAQQIGNVKNRKTTIQRKLKVDSKFSLWIDFLKSHKQNSPSFRESIEPGKPVVMVYSSGTTGASKGIVLTNAGINSTLRHYQSPNFPYKAGDTFLAMIPVWFSTGIVLSVLMPLCLGIRVIMEPMFTKENFARDIQKYKPNMTLSATSLWVYAIHSKELEKEDMAQFTYPITGGEQILPETEEEINRFLQVHNCNAPILKGYGMCELGSAITAASLIHNKANSVGYPIKGVTVAAFDMSTKEEMPYNERGEIWVDSPAHMKEYFHNLVATESFFMVDKTGRKWGRTGDIGYVDEDGDVYILGRASDNYYTKEGICVYAFDVEAVIHQEPTVLMCKVIETVVDRERKIIAHIVLKSPITEAVNDIVSRINRKCNERLKKYEIPHFYKITDTFPVHVNGKRDNEALKNDISDLIDVKNLKIET